MKYELKNWEAGVPYKNKRKGIILITLLGCFLFYTFFFSMKISQRVIVSLPVSDDLVISLAFSGFLAFIFSFRCKPLVNKSIKKRINQYCHRFFPMACFCFVTTFPLFSYYVYLFPNETNTYLTHYEIITPGPSIGRFSHCNKGIKIQDHYTSERFFLCFNDKKYSDYNNQALVIVQSNMMGSYLVNYDLSRQNTD